MEAAEPEVHIQDKAEPFRRLGMYFLCTDNEA